jgi:hypothetical protein
LPHLAHFYFGFRDYPKIRINPADCGGAGQTEIHLRASHPGPLPWGEGEWPSALRAYDDFSGSKAVGSCGRRMAAQSHHKTDAETSSYALCRSRRD